MPNLTTFNPNPALHIDMLRTQVRICILLWKRALREKDEERVNELVKEASLIRKAIALKTTI